MLYPKPPLCKGRWLSEGQTEGLTQETEQSPCPHGRPHGVAPTRLTEIPRSYRRGGYARGAQRNKSPWGIIRPHNEGNKKGAPVRGLFFCGACGRIRTGDLLITSELLCQLSHTSIFKPHSILAQLYPHVKTCFYHKPNPQKTELPRGNSVSLINIPYQ